MENKLDSMHSRGLVRSADTAVVRAITHEDIARHSRATTTHSNKPAVKAASARKPSVKTASAKARSTEFDEAEPKEKSRVFAYSVYLFFAIVILVLYLGIRYYDRETAKVKRFVMVEVGSPVAEDLFFNAPVDLPALEECNLDFSGVNIEVPQTIHFTITYLWTNMECELEIADSTPPTGVGIPQQIFSGEELPDVNQCVKDVSDRTAVTIKWGKIPDYKNGGEFKAEALLTDAVGNTASVMVPISVTKDSTPPVISGTKNYSGYVGSSIVYRDGVTVTDDYDKNPTLTIDTSNVNMSKAGKYKAIYTATDFSGNKTTAEIEVELIKKPKSYVEQETVDKAAQKILDKILKPGMTKQEQALQIVWWCRYNIRFVLRTQSSSWTEAAYNAYTKRVGNCYSTVYAVKVLLDVAGIKNMIIERYPHQTATHYWNYVYLNGQWYHCDSTPRKNYSSYFFMYTTKEIQNFHHDGWYGYNFKVAKYPASATKSVQKKIDYANHKIKK